MSTELVMASSARTPVVGGGNDAVADRREGDLEPVPPLEDGIFCLFNGGDVRQLRIPINTLTFLT
jgi:hypothetical protein